jgi:hypothetical protein
MIYTNNNNKNRRKRNNKKEQYTNNLFSWQRQLWGFNWTDYHNWNGVYAYPYIISAKANNINLMYPGAPLYSAETNNNNRALFQITSPDPNWSITHSLSLLSSLSPHPLFDKMRSQLGINPGHCDLGSMGFRNPD